jgi:hypothetical protein
MIGVIVTFTPDDKFDRSMLTKIADDSRGLFEGMPGLRFKASTVDDDALRARNLCVWDDEQKARGFFTDDLVEQVKAAYGFAPSIEYVDIVGFVDNSHA